MDRLNDRKEISMVLIIMGCVVWLVAQDILYLLPVMGIIGGMKALYEQN